MELFLWYPCNGHLEKGPGGLLQMAKLRPTQPARFDIDSHGETERCLLRGLSYRVLLENSHRGLWHFSVVPISWNFCVNLSTSFIVFLTRSTWMNDGVRRYQFVICDLGGKKINRRRWGFLYFSSKKKWSKPVRSSIIFSTNPQFHQQLLLLFLPPLILAH